MVVYALWSAPRSRSTALFRSMIERGDLVAVHEPISDLVALGEADAEGREFRTVEGFLSWLREGASGVDVFIKDTPNPGHRFLLEDHSFMASTRHAFLIRSPEEIAASFWAIEQQMTADSIGLRFLEKMHTAASEAQGRLLPVIDSADLVSNPSATMAAYCSAVGLPFMPEALEWTAGDRAEWRRSQRWHRDVSATSGFVSSTRTYSVTVDNSAELREFAARDRPAYERLRAHCLEVQ